MTKDGSRHPLYFAGISQKNLYEYPSLKIASTLAFVIVVSGENINTSRDYYDPKTHTCHRSTRRDYPNAVTVVLTTMRGRAAVCESIPDSRRRVPFLVDPLRVLLSHWQKESSATKIWRVEGGDQAVLFDQALRNIIMANTSEQDEFQCPNKVHGCTYKHQVTYSIRDREQPNRSSYRLLRGYLITEDCWYLPYLHLGRDLVMASGGPYYCRDCGDKFCHFENLSNHLSKNKCEARRTTGGLPM